jgi:hypothetical protein
MVAAVSISPVVKSIFEAESGDGSYRRSSEAVQVSFLITSFQVHGVVYFCGVGGEVEKWRSGVGFHFGICF